MDPTPAVDASTGTLESARAHARSQAGAVAETQSTVPIGRASDLPAGVDPGTVVWDETVGNGGYAARGLTRGSILSITDRTGDTCVNLQVCNAHQPAERLNPADTVKVQWQARLTEGTLLLSDLGRVLMTFVADDGEGHDALCGHSNRRRNEERYGHGRIGGPHPNVRDLLALAGARYGLERRDLTGGVNLFRRVDVGPAGELVLTPPTGSPARVELRADLDLVVLVAVGPHPLDDRPEGSAGTVRLVGWTADHPVPDPFRATTPERERAFENTDHHLLEGVR